MAKKLTITEAAKLCNTSKATVSRVINNPELVAEPLRSRVMEMLTSVGYKPDPYARRLGSHERYGVALFVYDIINPFFALVFREIGNLCIKKGIPLMVYETENNKEQEKIYLDFVLQNKVSGIIFTEGVSKDIVNAAIKHIPVVLVDQHDTPGRVSEVASDNYHGAFEAVEYLIQLKHRNIGFVTGTEGWSSAKERYNGYLSALRRNNIPYRKELVFEGDFQLESGIRAMEYFLGCKKWPSAILCSNDQMALGVLHKANMVGISIPHDVSLVGFDGIPFISWTRPSLTTVKQDIEALGRIAFEMLMRQIEEKDNFKIEKRIVPTHLQVGDSCRKAEGAEEDEDVKAT